MSRQLVSTLSLAFRRDLWSYGVPSYRRFFSHTSRWWQKLPTEPFRGIQPSERLQITFTCTAPLPEDTCNHRSTHKFSRQSYEQGVVLIRCPKCRNRHLIADHLGYFETIQNGGKGIELGEGEKLGRRTVESLMSEKGERVRKGWLVEQGEGETVEILRDEEAKGSEVP